MFKKKKITNIPDLESALKDVYDRTDPEVASEFMGGGKFPRVHNVSGCCDCPFVRQISNGEGFIHTFCIWDGNKGDITQYVESNSITPADCPLQSESININLKPKNNESI